MIGDRLALCCAAVAVVLLVGIWRAAPAEASCIRGYHTPPTLYHGTAALGFAHAGQARDTWRFPDGPAWLGTNAEFAVHAAMRHVSGMGQVTLFAYTKVSRSQLYLVSCDTPEQAAAYAVASRGLRARDRNSDSRVAARFCSDAQPRLDGYRIAADRVRGETEYIICSPIGVFAVTGIRYSFWDVRGDRLGGVTGRLATPGTGRQAHYFLADVNPRRRIDLTCFLRLPQTDQGSCSDPTKPRIACCLPPPRPPPRGQR